MTEWIRIAFAVGACVVVLALAACDCTAGIMVESLEHEAVSGPGGRYCGTVSVRNVDSEPHVARLYKSDYLYYSDGRNVFGEPGGDDRSNADWITFSSNYVEVPPGGSTVVEFTVQVPDDASLRGSYWSLVMVEEISAQDDAALSAVGVTACAGVVQKVRYAVQVVTHIGETGSRDISFGRKEVERREAGEGTLKVEVENTGERGLRPNLWVELYDAGGSRVGRFEAGRRRLYPGTSVNYAVDLKAGAGGTYQALVVVDNGDEYVFGAQYDLKL